MTFTDNIKQIEKIKEKYNSKYLVQETKLIPVISELSKVVVDSDNINETFAKLVSYYLSYSDFKFFNNVLLDNEVQFIANAIGYGDTFKFKYDNKNQIYEIEYQTSDKNSSIVLKNKTNKITIKTVTDNLNGTIYETKSTFKQKDNEYYKSSYYKRTILTDNELIGYSEEKFKYNPETEELVKEIKTVTKDETKEVSKTCISTIVDPSDFVIEEGMFYVINKKDEKNKIRRVKALENILVGNNN